MNEPHSLDEKHTYIQEPQEITDLALSHKDTPSFTLLSSESDSITISGSYINNRNNTHSIKDALNGTTKSTVVEPEDDSLLLDDENDNHIGQENIDYFTENELLEQWKKFANQIRNQHPRLYNTLLANKPYITNQTSIQFELSNPLQEEALNKIKPELICHLRRKLNKKIELMFSINKTLQDKRLYLPEEKFEHMLKKNPHLAIFRQKLNLDFE